MDKVFGRNPVTELLKSDAQVEKLYVNRELNTPPIQQIMRMAKQKGIIVSACDGKKLDFMSGNGAHQGVLAVISQTEYCSVDDLLQTAQEKGEPPFLVMLDGIEDPHNLGAIIRSCNVAGVHGVIIPKHRAAGVNATVYKASAGAVNYTKVAKVSNLKNTMGELKEKGLWFFGAEADGDQMYYQADLKGPVCIVIGSEGSGISRLVREGCDFLVKIPVMGQINSLNASVAAGILIFETLKQRLSGC